ncbi:MAG: hypothetical protein VXW87_00175 [Pseudomonadota bacterium]|nr:hypothetical protein [Pseudomonadota bacterium]
MLRVLIDNPNGIFSNRCFDQQGVSLITASEQLLKKHSLNKWVVDQDIDIVCIMQNSLAKELRDQLPCDDRRICIPSAHDLKFEDKYYFSEWMKHNGFSHLLPMPTGKGPVVVKYGNDRAGRGVQIHHHIDDVQHVEGEGVVIQRAIPGLRELAIHVIADQGELVEMIVFEHDFSSVTQDPLYIRGEGVHNKIVRQINCFSHYREIKEIISKMGYHGVGCFDGKIHDGKMYLFEMNTHIGGSMFFYNHHHGMLAPFLSRLQHQYANTLRRSDVSAQSI